VHGVLAGLGLHRLLIGHDELAETVHHLNELPRSKLRGIKPPNPETFVLRTAMARQFGGVDHRVSWVCTACGP
jgi:hypothetical protein